MRLDVLLNARADEPGLKSACTAALSRALTPFASEIHYASLCLDPSPLQDDGSVVLNACTLRLRVDFNPHGRLLLEIRDGEPERLVVKGMIRLEEAVESWLVARWRREARPTGRESAISA